MLMFALWFIIGLLIGVVSLRLLTWWQPKHTSQTINTPYKRHHS